MHDNWKKLKHPPIVLAIFQIKYKQVTKFEFSNFLRNDEEIRKLFPKRKDATHSNVGLPGTIPHGISVIKAKTDTKISTYSYLTEGLEEQFIIERDNVRFHSESEYIDWDTFIDKGLNCLNLIRKQLGECNIERTSIRFVNKFKFKEFDNPLDYFGTVISSDSESISDIPISAFSYNIKQQDPETGLRIIINHALEKVENNFDYYFDIDVLDDGIIDFSFELIKEKLNKIRTIKNKIFFETVKEKALEQCE